MHPLDELYRKEPLVYKGEKYRLYLYEHRSDLVGFSGHDMGPRLTIARRTETNIIIRCGGHSTFASTSEQAYVPTQYWKCKIVGQPDDRGCIPIEVIDTLIPGRNRKATKAFINA